MSGDRAVVVDEGDLSVAADLHILLALKRCHRHVQSKATWDEQFEAH